MFYGLSHIEEEFYANNLERVLLLAACFYPVSDDAKSLEEGVFRYREYGVDSLYDDTWYYDGIKTVCKNFPFKKCIEALFSTGDAPISVRSLVHYMQGAI